MNPVPRRHVVVFGGSACQPGDEAYENAQQLGAAFAGKGWVVVNGGYGGTMLAGACGAARAGGRVIGVTCRLFNAQPNEFVTETIETEDLYSRLRRLIELGDAYVALPGSTGTLAELATVWELVNKRMIPTRPILCWGDFWRPIVQVFEQDSTRDSRINTRDLAERRGELISFVSRPEQAVEVIGRAFGD